MTEFVFNTTEENRTSTQLVGNTIFQTGAALGLGYLAGKNTVGV